MNLIEDAVSDLLQKFVLSSVYGSLEYIVGIAIAGDIVQVLRLRGEKKSDVLASFNLSSSSGSIASLIAMVNIGRWCKSVGARNTLHPLVHQYGKKFINPDGRCELTVGFHMVKKNYLQLSESRAKDLVAFYESTAAVRFVEHLIKPHNLERGKLTLYLTPVGLPVSPDGPRTLDDAVMALQRILEFIFYIHEKGWCVLDLRWPNVVQTRVLGGGFRFVLIDCEYATRVGQPLPPGIKPRFSAPLAADGTASFLCDWFMIAEMANLANVRLCDHKLQDFAAFLGDCNENVDFDTVKRHAIFHGRKWEL